MKPLRWSWTVRFGPFLRATVGSQPWLVAAVPLIGGGTFLLAPHVWSTTARAVAGVVVAALAAVAFVSALRRQLVRRRLTARGKVQTYALGLDALVLSVGKDSYSLPTGELLVAGQGRDWLAVRRRGMGRRPLLLFFDEVGMRPQVEAVLREHGARRRS